MLPLIAGDLTALDEGTWRVLAPNPSMMTGPGTNTYIVHGDDGLIVIDPGPASDQHTAALLSASKELEIPITKIIVTHTHNDHSPGAKHLLQHLSDALLLGPDVPNDGLQDTTWEADTLLKHGDTLALHGGGKLRVIATPGHVGNHLCFLHEPKQLLFTGDHLINGSTVVIAPPSGSMSAYLNSLTILQNESITTIAPGHGNLIDTPQEYITQTIAHRLKREEKVKAALIESEGQTLKELVLKAYDDTPSMLHGLATYSLWAHLIKLEEDNVAKQDKDERWWLLN